MGRPRKYQTDAERHAAAARRQAEFRDRSIILDRHAVEALMAAVQAAAAAGDGEAQQVQTADPNGLLRNLTLHWLNRAVIVK